MPTGYAGVMNRRSLWPSALAPLLALSACASLAPSSLHHGTDELQQALDRRFPVERRWLELLDVTVQVPHLSPLPGRQKLAVALQASLHDRVFGGQWVARLGLESGLRWQASDQTLRLAGVQVTGLGLSGQGQPPALDRQRLGAALIAPLLEDLVVLKMTPAQLERLGRWGVQPSGVRVEDDGVRLMLAPR